MMTAYDYQRLQVAGTLEEKDYDDAMRSYQEKITFLNKCIEEASRFDIDTLREDKVDFCFLWQELKREKEKIAYVKAFDEWKSQ